LEGGLVKGGGLAGRSRPCLACGVRVRLGVDENGLGAGLGPMLVTAVMARVAEPAESKLFRRKLPRNIAKDLDDSKRLVAHGRVELGEAWARALVGPGPCSPQALFEALSLEGMAALTAPCSKAGHAQCWGTTQESFRAPEVLVGRLERHLERLRALGLEVLAVRSSVACTKVLNEARARGESRFAVDLHAMERLILELQQVSGGGELHAVCGKVGGMQDYERFFGPLSGRLRVQLKGEKGHSAYRFPGLGEVHFVQDADAQDPLVMLASLVGKYLRELLMARVARYYWPGAAESALPSGYHDPLSARFSAEVSEVRRRRRIPLGCFQRS
jgi:ribonuclease HII